MSAVEPLFDSPRRALHFALNHHLAMPRPQMNKMMADGKVQRIELADGTRITVAMPLGRPRSAQLRGLDGAATAGIILQHLARLSEPEQLVLMAETIQAILPCACRAPCCGGSKPNPEWSRSILKLCDHLREEAELSRIPGKKGMSTAPMMRRALIEKYFLPKRKLVMADLAKACHVSQQTVLNHQKPIEAFLGHASFTGWRALDEHLSEAGIVGMLD